MTHPTGRSRMVRLVFEVGGRFLSHGASFAANLLVLRGVGLSGYGLFALCLTIQALASLGWNQNVLGVVAAQVSLGHHERPWFVYLWRHATISLAFAMTLWLATGNRLFAIAALIGLSEAIFVLARPRLVALRQQATLAIAVVAAQVVRLGLIAAFLLTGRLTVTTAILAQLPGYVVGALVQARAARGMVNTEPTSTHWRVGWRPVASDFVNTAVRFGPTALVFGGAGQVAAGAFDVVMRGAYLLGEGAASLGVVDLPDRLAGNRRSQSRRSTIVMGALLSVAAASAYVLLYPPVLARVSEILLSPALVAAGAAATVGVSLFGLSRTMLWESTRGRKLLLASQGVAGLLFVAVFVVARSVEATATSFTFSFAMAWLLAAVLGLAAVARDRREPSPVPSGSHTGDRRGPDGS